MARGTVNVPAKGSDEVKPHAATHGPKGSDPINLSEIGAQEALSGKAGQYVGFDENGKPTAFEFTGTENLSGEEGQYVGFDKDGKPVAKDFPDGGSGSGNEGGSTTPGTGGTFYGTIGTNWTKDESSGVYIQVVPIEGILAAHESAVLDVVMIHERTPEGYAQFVEENNQFLEFITNGDAETVDGGIKFYIYGDAPTVSIPIIVEVG